MFGKAAFSPIARMFRLGFLLLALAAVALASPMPDVFREGRIVGGQAATLGQFPYQASLRTPANFHFCGAAIISQHWVTSAAHCTISRTPANTRIVVGTVSLNTVSNGGGVTHEVSVINNHPSYNAQWISHDVCTVRSAQPFTFTANVASIPLASVHSGAGLNAVVSGWGGTAVTGGAAPNILQWIAKNTLTNAHCQSLHTVGNSAFVFEHKICTFNAAGQGICQGDSGGPLTANGQLIGTVSWNIPCARGFPDAYDRTFYFRAWIIANSDNLG